MIFYLYFNGILFELLSAILRDYICDRFNNNIINVLLPLEASEIHRGLGSLCICDCLSGNSRMYTVIYLVTFYVNFDKK